MMDRPGVGDCDNRNNPGKVSSPCRLCLVEAVKGGKPGLAVEAPFLEGEAG